MAETGKIYELIAKGMAEIGAIGKDKTSKDRSGGEQFKYRGIDQVYNALNPVLSKLGIFFVPEVLDHHREERTTKSGSILIYTIMKIRYTAYASDGSNVQMVTVGEAMDTGDKSTNKAMSVAMKYAMFQLFCIPTEEMKDPDADVYNDVMPRGQVQKAPAKKPENGEVQKSQSLPPEANAPAETKQADPQVLAYIKNEIQFMAERNELPFLQMKARFETFRKELVRGKAVPDIVYTEMTMDDAKNLVEAVYTTYMTDKKDDS